MAPSRRPGGARAWPTAAGRDPGEARRADRDLATVDDAPDTLAGDLVGLPGGTAGSCAPAPATTAPARTCRRPGRARRPGAGSPPAVRAGRTTAATAGRPLVRVPVLSISSVVQLARRSSTAPPFTTTPRRAATDRPDTNATGTARMSGQAWPPRARRPPAPPRPGPCGRGSGQGDTQEPQCVTVGQPDERGLRCLGLRNQPHDPGVRAVGGRGGRQQVERPARVDHPAAHRVARRALDRKRLPGERGLIQHRRAASHRAVDGNHVTGGDHQQVTGPDQLQGNRLERFAAVAARGSSAPVRAAFEGPGGPGRPPIPPGPGRLPA